MILAELVCKVNAAHCFSVLADETADVSAVEQFSLGVRYIDCTLGKVTEDFFCNLCQCMTCRAKAWLK